MLVSGECLEDEFMENKNKMYVKKVVNIYIYIYIHIEDTTRRGQKTSELLCDLGVLQQSVCFQVPLSASAAAARIMFTPPCFMVGMVFLGLYSSFFFLQTQRVEFRPKSSIFVSSDQGTLRALQDFNP